MLYDEAKEKERERERAVSGISSTGSSGLGSSGKY